MKSEWNNSEETDGKANSPGYTFTGEDTGVDPNLRLIRLFNHYRHDWMNDIQLLFGYVKLKKYDKLDDLMEKIKDKVQRESYVSKLGHTDLIVYLLSFQAEVKDMLLEIELKKEIHLNELALDSRRLCGLLISLVEAFKSNAVYHADGEHRLTVEFVEETDRLRINARYYGLISEEHLLAKLKRIQLESSPKAVWSMRLTDERTAAIDIEMPFHT